MFTENEFFQEIRKNNQIKLGMGIGYAYKELENIPINHLGGTFPQEIIKEIRTNKGLCYLKQGNGLKLHEINSFVLRISRWTCIYGNKKTNE
jgi:hypothetical protein